MSEEDGNEVEYCYMCGCELSDEEDSGRCEGCMDHQQEKLGEGWDN
jgi:hypothetical protein